MAMRAIPGGALQCAKENLQMYFQKEGVKVSVYVEASILKWGRRKRLCDQPPMRLMVRLHLLNMFSFM
jgi:hypothetical protein